MVKLNINSEPSTFGSTYEVEAEKVKSKSQKTCEWLMSKYEEERKRERENGAIGIRLNRWFELSNACDGLRKGLITVVAKSHIGKSTFLIDLMIDALETNPRLKVVLYSIDDDKDEMRVMIIANKSQVYKNIVEVKRTSEDIENKIKDAYDFFTGKAAQDKFVVQDIEEIENIDQLVDDIEQQFEDSKQFLVCIDGFMNLESKGQQIRMQHIYRANKIMRCANKFEIPIVANTEVPKDAPLRVTRNHIMDSVKYAFNSKVCICISHLDKDQKKKTMRGENGLPKSIHDGMPILHFCIDKNKYGGSGEVFFRYLDGAKSRFINVPKDLYSELEVEALSAELEDLKNRKNK